MIIKKLLGPAGKMGRIQLVLTIFLVLAPLWFFFNTLSLWVDLLNAGGIFFYGFIVYCFFATYMVYMSIIRRLRDSRFSPYWSVLIMSPISIPFLLFLAVFPPRVEKPINPED